MDKSSPVLMLRCHLACSIFCVRDCSENPTATTIGVARNCNEKPDPCGNALRLIEIKSEEVYYISKSKNERNLSINGFFSFSFSYLSCVVKAYFLETSSLTVISSVIS